MASRGRSRIIVRRAEQRDCARLSQIYNDAIRSGVSTMDTELVDSRYFIAQLSTFTDREVLLVGESKVGVVGWSVAKRYSDRPGYLHTCETSVYVSAEQQGKGYGSVLQQAVVERADAFGYRHLVAKILAVNEWSIEFHKRFHYEIVGTQRKIGFLNGQWHDVVIMQRILDAARQGQQEDRNVSNFSYLNSYPKDQPRLAAGSLRPARRTRRQTSNGRSGSGGNATRPVSGTLGASAVG